MKTQRPGPDRGDRHVAEPLPEPLAPRDLSSGTTQELARAEILAYLDMQRSVGKRTS